MTSWQGGILQAPISAPPYLQTRQVDAIFLSAFGIPGPTFADPFLGATNPFAPGTFPFGITHLTLANDLRPPYAQNWNLTLQREVRRQIPGRSPICGNQGDAASSLHRGQPAHFQRGPAGHRPPAGLRRLPRDGGPV